MIQNVQPCGMDGLGTVSAKIQMGKLVNLWRPLLFHYYLLHILTSDRSLKRAPKQVKTEPAKHC